MGRKSLNRTPDEQRQIINERRMRYYWKHGKQERANALARYYQKKSEKGNL